MPKYLWMKSFAVISFKIIPGDSKLRAVGLDGRMSSSKAAAAGCCLGARWVRMLESCRAASWAGRLGPGAGRRRDEQVDQRARPVHLLQGPYYQGHWRPYHDEKFVRVKEAVPGLVVPELARCRLKPHVNNRAPAGTAAPLTAQQRFREATTPAMEQDFKDRTCESEHLGKDGFEPTQEGNPSSCTPMNFPH